MNKLEQTKYGYTGQYSYVSDFGLHFYNARWYDSSLGRFAQADTIVPSGGQGLDRYAYTFNNPIAYNDPSGHKPCLEDNYKHGKCLNESEYFEYSLEEKYSIKIRGNWDLNKLKLLEESLMSSSTLVGGVDILIDIFNDSLKNNNSSSDNLIFLLTSDNNAQTICGSESACWNRDQGSIVFSPRHFGFQYQEHKRRPDQISNTDINPMIKKTMIHEISHVITDGRPSIETAYKWFVNDPKLYGDSSYESLANALAFYALTNGNYTYDGLAVPDQINFVTNIASFFFIKTPW